MGTNIIVTIIVIVYLLFMQMTANLFFFIYWREYKFNL